MMVKVSVCPAEGWAGHQYDLIPFPYTHTHMDSLGLFLWEEGVMGQWERPGLLLHWSTPTSYFLDDPAPSGEVIG